MIKARSGAARPTKPKRDTVAERKIRDEMVAHNTIMCLISFFGTMIAFGTGYYIMLAVMRACL